MEAEKQKLLKLQREEKYILKILKSTKLKAMKWKKRIGLDKNLFLKELLPFVFLIGTSSALEGKENPKLTIKKCCPKGQELNSTFMCINAMEDLKNDKVNNTQDAGKKVSYIADNPSKIFFTDFNNSFGKTNFSFVELFQWFPFTSIISAETLERITDLGSVKDLLKKAKLEYGVHPECAPEEKEWSCFRAQFSEQFYLIFYPGQNFELYISKKSSHHDLKKFKDGDGDCGFFKTESEQNRSKAKGGESLGKRPFNAHELRTFPSRDFCVDKGPKGSFLVEYCPCKTVPCLRKCCRDSEVFDNIKKKCVSNATFGFWRPSLKNSTLTRNYYLLSNRYPSTCVKPHWLKIPLSANPNFKKSCGNQLNQEERNKFYFFSDGSLKVKKYEIKIPTQSYCGDHMIYDMDNFEENNLLICLEDSGSLSKFRVYGILFVFGGIVLLVTITISLYLPELRSSVYNKVIIGHNVSLMLADFIWGSTYLLSYVTHTLCIFLSLAIQCTFLGSFFWMNVMCLDISLGIRRLKSHGETVDDNHKFKWYLIYACGGPIIITSVTAAMEFAPSLPPHYVRPGFGCYNCGFNPDSMSILIYVYGPMIAIILLNIIFFIMTVFQIIKIQKETAILDNQKSSANTINNGKKRLVIFGKLFLLMGLSWIMEIVGWLVGGKDYYWYFPDFVNILRAVFIFIIFICKKKVLYSLMKKLKGLSTVHDEVCQSRKNTATETEWADIKKREQMLRRQLTQTFRRLDESGV